MDDDDSILHNNICGIQLTAFIPRLAYAQTPAPAPEKGWERVGWAIGCVEKIPSGMVIWLIALGLLLAAAIGWCVYGKKHPP